MAFASSRRISLIGPPNVGKSSLFSRLTGVGVICSNYSGTTVEFEEASVERSGVRLDLVDLPGTYSLSAHSPDEEVVARDVVRGGSSAALVVADALNPEPGIVLCLEVEELGLPAVLALNRSDAAERCSSIDHEALSVMLRIPVVQVSAKTGRGIGELLDILAEGALMPSDPPSSLAPAVAGYVDRITGMLPVTGLAKRGLAVKLLEGAGCFGELVSGEVLSAVGDMVSEHRRIYGQTPDIAIAKGRFDLASAMVSRTVSRLEGGGLKRRISDLTVSPSTGFPILICVMAGMLAAVVLTGQWLSSAISGCYHSVVGDFITDIGANLGGVFWESVFSGINTSILAVLTLVVPYIMPFYILLGVLEDSGYLPRAVVLLHRTMRRFGLHGGGFIPMIVGLGCNLPAVMATRSLPSRRERLIVCTLIAVSVPCSAQMAIIVGVTGANAGMRYAAMIALILICLSAAVALILDRMLPRESGNLAVELPEMVMPMARNVLYKMWARTREFFTIAVPLLVIGSIVLEFLFNTGAMDSIVEPMSFLTVGMLGLPAVTIMAFIAGMVRKEMSYGVLLMLLGEPLSAYMTPVQFVVFGAVMAVYMPCIATMAAMGREIGWKETAAITTASIAVAVTIGTLLNLLLG